ncbi:MAG: nuclear transport factor 2 family protein [Thermoleophilia bacterium]
MLTSPIRSQVLAANDAFYDAFRRRDLGDFMACWAERDDVVFIPPMGDPWFGREVVERGLAEQWREELHWQLETEVLAVAYDDPVATVTCREHLACNEDLGADFDLLATNTFVLGPEGWRMTHHHVSWRTARQTEPLTG